jgi:hypothetical protein
MAGFAIAKMIERGTDMLHRMSFDRWMREGGVTRLWSEPAPGWTPLRHSEAGFLTVMLLVIVLAADALGIEAVSSYSRSCWLISRT